MKTLRVILIRSAVVVLLLAAIAVGTVLVRRHRTFDAPYPDIHASSDPALIERGRYLVRGPAHCAECHNDPTQPRAASDPERPMSGGFEFKLPFGVVYTRNITPDPTTGIGRYSDAQLARILRYGVHADGRAVLPFMPFADLTDADLTAVISYLRSQPPVKHAVPAHDLNFVGDAVLAFLITPRGPTATPAAHLTPAPTAEYGRYLANTVGNCAGCHTQFDLGTGKPAGPLFSGGAQHPSLRDPSTVFVTPNLTPDPRWGWISHWSEDMFVARMQGGRLHADSPMPWEAYRRMSADDVRALYRYLRSLPAAQGGPDPQAGAGAVVATAAAQASDTRRD